MFLTKLLNKITNKEINIINRLNKNNILNTYLNRNTSNNIHYLFLDNLKQQLFFDLDIFYNNIIKDSNKNSELITNYKFKLFYGIFNTNKTKIIKKNNDQEINIDYLFIQIPTTNGLLLRFDENNILILEQSVMTLAQTKDFFGDKIHQPTFVSKKQILENFEILEYDLVRTTSAKTLSLEQVSELLLILALDILEKNYEK